MLCSQGIRLVLTRFFGSWATTEEHNILENFLFPMVLEDSGASCNYKDYLLSIKPLQKGNPGLRQ